MISFNLWQPQVLIYSPRHPYLRRSDVLLSKWTGEKSLPMLNIQPTSLMLSPGTLENSVNYGKLSTEM